MRKFGGPTRHLAGLSALIVSASVAAGDTATVSGTITDLDSGEPIAGATAAVAQAINAGAVWAATTDASGGYTIEVPMAGVTSHVVFIEAASPEHAPARRGGTPMYECYFGCGFGDGRVVIEPDDVLVGQNIALARGGRISGTVTAEDTTAALPGARVEPISAAPSGRTGQAAAYSFEFHGFADDTGNYLLPLALPPGDVHLRSRAPTGENYVTQAWNGVSCQWGACPFFATDTVGVSSGSVTPDIDFSLPTGAALSGQLLPNNVDRSVLLFDGSGQFLTARRLMSGQNTWHIDRLAGGSYYVQLGGPTSGPLVRQLHNGLPCPFAGCERARGAPLGVPAGATLSGIDIALVEGGQISDRIIDAQTGTPPTAQISDRDNVPYPRYHILTADGTVVGSGRMSIDEDEVILEPSSGLPPGDYYLRTFSSWRSQGIGYEHTPDSTRFTLPDYTDAVYPDEPCAGLHCDLDKAQAISVTSGTTVDITIEVSQGSNISGMLVDDDTGTPISRVNVLLVNAANQRMAATFTDDDGEFFFGAFPAGTYYLRTAMSATTGQEWLPMQNAFFDRVHGATELCSELLCDPSDGTALSVDGSSHVSGLELRVSAGPVISGQVFDQLTGVLINRGAVEVRDSLNRLVGRYDIHQETGNYQTTALPPGTYTLTPVVSPAYVAVTESGSPGTAGSSRQDSVTGAQGGTVVTLGSESIEANLAVVDVAIDTVFRDRFVGE